jgi:hypothetical protein
MLKDVEFVHDIMRRKVSVKHTLRRQIENEPLLGVGA